MVKVIHEDNTEIKFKNIPCGNVFVVNNKIFMKCNSKHIKTDEGIGRFDHNCVNLETGELFVFDWDDMVHHIPDARIVIGE